jgi:hypothetical protein
MYLYCSFIVQRLGIVSFSRKPKHAILHAVNQFLSNFKYEELYLYFYVSFKIQINQIYMIFFINRSWIIKSNILNNDLTSYFIGSQ